MTPSLAHLTPFRSRRSLAKVSTNSREPQCSAPTRPRSRAQDLVLLRSSVGDTSRAGGSASPNRANRAISACHKCPCYEGLTLFRAARLFVREPGVRVPHHLSRRLATPSPGIKRGMRSAVAKLAALMSGPPRRGGEAQTTAQSAAVHK